MTNVDRFAANTHLTKRILAEILSNCVPIHNISAFITLFNIQILLNVLFVLCNFAKISHGIKAINVLPYLCCLNLIFIDSLATKALWIFLFFFQKLANLSNATSVKIPE